MPSYLSPGVYVEEIEAGSRPIEGVGTAVAAFVGLAAEGPFNAPTLVTNWSQFTQTFGDFIDGSYLAHAVYAYFLNGGGTCYVVRIGDRTDTADDDRPAAAPAARGGAKRGGKAVPPAGERVALGGFQVAALEGAGDGLSVEIADTAGDSVAEDAFTLLVRRGDRTEESFDVSAKRSQRNYVVQAVREKSRLIVVEEPAGTTQAALTRPGNQTVPVPAGAAGPPAVVMPASLSPAQYVGNAADRTGFAGLEAVDEVTMLVVPDVMSAYEQGALDAEGVKAVQLAMIAHCELMGNRVAVIDPLPDLNPQQVKDWRQTGAGYDSKYAALYYPWIKVADPATGRLRFVPPGGAMAGIWARTDESRGVHKAPANEVVRGAVELATQLTKAENDLLNPIGVNCIRAFPGRGIRVWGARTLSSDPAWRYLNVRRLFNYLEESIMIGTQWVVFESNDDALWARIRRTISAFLVNEWRKGALFGLTPDEAFYVKCDRETNPAEGIDAGQVVCEIGIAPVKPAEFVIFRLAQFSGGTSLVNE
jgi:uncharacterized protein